MAQAMKAIAKTLPRTLKAVFKKGSKMVHRPKDYVPLRLKKRSNNPKQSSGPKIQSQASAPQSFGTLVRNPNRPATILSHRESIGQVDVSTTFTLQSYSLNPAQSNIFPWGSSVASKYDLYRVKHFEIIYVPRCSSQTNGQISMAIEPDPADRNPSSMSQIENTEGSISNNLWSLSVLKYRNSSANTAARKYMRAAGDQTNELRACDFGNLHIGTIGPAAISAVGELYVDYTFELYAPIGNDALTSAHLALTTNDMKLPFKSWQTGLDIYNLPFEITNTSISNLPPGYWFIQAVFTSDDAGRPPTSFSSWALTGMSTVTTFNYDGHYPANASNSLTTTVSTSSSLGLHVTNVSNSITFTSPTYGTNPANQLANIFIIKADWLQPIYLFAAPQPPLKQDQKSDEPTNQHAYEMLDFKTEMHAKTPPLVAINSHHFPHPSVMAKR
jgi:hypothetical protein